MKANTKYSIKELRKELGITDYAWETKKEDLLEYFKYFFDYEIHYQGRSTIFFIKEIYETYIPLPRKTKAKEIAQFYHEETEHLIKYKPLNTGSNIAREIIDTDNRYNHKEDTAARYVRSGLKENYKVADEKVWCEPNYFNHTYIPLSETQVKELNELFIKYMGSDATRIAGLIAEAESGQLSSEELKNKLINGSYNDAICEFKKKYGFRPIKIGEYIKNAF